MTSGVLSPTPDARPWILGGLAALITIMSMVNATIIVPTAVRANQSVWEAQDASSCSDATGSFDGAYPGARGFGACNRGGSVPGTTITTVTNTSSNPATSGSLPWALQQSCPQVIVFEIGGEFDVYQSLKSGETAGNVCDGITIAGETAPAPGVAITNGVLQPRYSNWIMSHVYVMIGDDEITWTDTDPDLRDGIRGGLNSDQENWFIYNSTFMYSIDETISCYPQGENFNTKWSFQSVIFGPPLANSIHPNGLHNRGPLFNNRCSDFSINRSVFMHAGGRNPRAMNYDTWHVNNIVYNHSYAPLELAAGDPALTYDSGTHDAATSTTVLTDSGNAWKVDSRIGWEILNSTDGSTGVITDNDATTLTVSGGLSGGTDNDFDSGDSYRIFPRHYINYENSFVVMGEAQIGASSVIAVLDDETIYPVDIYDNGNALWDAGAQERDCDSPANNCLEGDFATGTYTNLVSSEIARAKPAGAVPEDMPSTDAGQIALAQMIIDHAGPRPADRPTDFTSLSNGLQDIVERMEAGGTYDSWCDTPAGCFGWPDDDSDWTNGNTHDLSTSLDVCGPIPDDLGGSNDKDDIMSSGFTRLHEWLVCKQDLVMPTGWREYGAMSFD